MELTVRAEESLALITVSIEHSDQRVARIRKSNARRNETPQMLLNTITQ